MNLQGIRKADGLSEDDAKILDVLIRTNSRYTARNKKLVDYYEGDAQPKPIGIDTFPEKVHVDARCDWPKKAVTSVSERSRFDGFIFENGETDPELDEVVRQTSLKSAYNRHVHSELIHGCMFATVNRLRKDDGDDLCQVRFHTAETSAAIWDDLTGCIGAGFVIADMRRPPWNVQGAPVPMQVNLHLPGRTVVIKRDATSHWKAESLDIPLDRPSMEAFAFRPTGLKPFGSSRIDKTVMSITDDVIRTRQNMAVASAIYAAPQKYLLGLSQEAYKEMLKAGKWNAYIGNLLMTTTDENGEKPTYGQLSPSSPQPYIDIIRLDAMTFAGATGVPLSSLGIVYDNPSSAEAIQASREDICIAAEDLNQSNGESLRNVALMVMAVCNDTSIDGLSEQQQTVAAKFLNPSKPSIVSQAQAAVQIAAAAPYFAKTDVFTEMLGFSEADRRRLAAARSIEDAQSLLSNFGPASVLQPQETTETASERTTVAVTEE